MGFVMQLLEKDKKIDGFLFLFWVLMNHKSNIIPLTGMHEWIPPGGFVTNKLDYLIVVLAPKSQYMAASKNLPLQHWHCALPYHFSIKNQTH